MKVIDLLECCANKKEGYFKFYVKYRNNVSKENCIHWEYKDGYVISDDEDNLFYFICNGTYDLNHEVIIIEDLEDRLPDIEVDKNYISIDGKKYTATVSVRKLALILKNVIEDIRELKGEK